MSEEVNYVDIILIAVAGMATWHGWRKGFIDSTIEIGIWLGSFLLTLFLSEKTILLFKSFDISGIWVRPVFFMVMLIVFSRLIFVWCDRLSDAVPVETHIHILNRVAGTLPGLLAGTIYASLLAFFFMSYQLGHLSHTTRQSSVAQILTRQTDWPGRQLSNIFDELGHRLGSSFTVYPKGTESIPLPFTSSTYQVRKDLEIRMLSLINEERYEAGRRPLEFDDEMVIVARKHAADMLKRGYFSHYTPEGKSPFDRIRKEGLRFLIAGENLAFARTLELAHEGLMESPDHRANILHRSFGRVGIGVLDAGVHGLIITQNFRN